MNQISKQEEIEKEQRKEQQQERQQQLPAKHCSAVVTFVDEEEAHHAYLELQGQFLTEDKCNQIISVYRLV